MKKADMKNGDLYLKPTYIEERHTRYTGALIYGYRIVKMAPGAQFDGHLMRWGVQRREKTASYEAGFATWDEAVNYVNQHRLPLYSG